MEPTRQILRRSRCRFRRIPVCGSGIPRNLHKGHRILGLDQRKLGVGRSSWETSRRNACIEI
ncbi:UNVERIFIED_CONTAM: hypothetical protein GTU68_031739 [Idotea baltica]|nr:hypothetical protein [Idotea baltica]